MDIKFDRENIDWQKVGSILVELEGTDGWFDRDNVAALSIIKLPKNSTILELGSYAGRSTMSLGILFPDAKITTCDDRDNCDPKRKDNTTFVKSKGYDLEWDKPIDLLLIDDDHTYETVKRDIIKFKPFIKNNGYIYFHDYYRDGDDFGNEWGITKAVEEMFNKDDILYIPRTSKEGFSVGIWQNKLKK